LLAEHGRRPEDIGGENGLLKQPTKAILERALNAEMTEHLGYEKPDPAGLISIPLLPRAYVAAIAGRL